MSDSPCSSGSRLLLHAALRQGTSPAALCSTRFSWSPGLAGFLSIAYMNGGPVAAVWGWFGVSLTNFLVALSMAEIVSAYPIAGGPYFW